MALTAQERAWLEKAEAASQDINSAGNEGVSLRIVVYLLRQVVSCRDEIAALKARVEALEP